MSTLFIESTVLDFEGVYSVFFASMVGLRMDEEGKDVSSQHGEIAGHTMELCEGSSGMLLLLSA